MTEDDDIDDLEAGCEEWAVAGFDISKDKIDRVFFVFKKWLEIKNSTFVVNFGAVA